MLKQTTCDYIANNLGNVMETTVCGMFISTLTLSPTDVFLLGLDRFEGQTTGFDRYHSEIMFALAQIN